MRRGPGRAIGATLGALACVGAALVSSCSVTLGTQPFACADGKTCPSGYSCQSNVCVQDGQNPKVTRALRITYINRSEMYWFASPQGGASLLVNDGFSPGARGIYEIHVAPDGKASPAVKLLPFPGEQTVSSSAVVLDDKHYGLVTMNFPGALDDSLVMRVHSLPRDGSAPPSDVVLHEDSYGFAGGYEPAYIGAIVRGDELDYAFTDPGQGGAVVVTRLKKDGTFISKYRIPLPAGVLPLSGDCALWQAQDGRVMLRVGLDVQRVYSLDIDQGLAAIVPASEGYPLFGFGNSVAYLDSNADGSQVTVVVRDITGNTLGSSSPEPYDPNVQPYTAVGFGAGALIAPLSNDASFKTLQVGYVGADGKFAHVASVERPGDDGLYTARAFASDGTVYVAWTSFHDQLMDLWVAVSPLGALP